METKNDNKVVYISRGLNQFSDFIPSLQLADYYTSLPIWTGGDCTFVPLLLFFIYLFIYLLHMHTNKLQ
jgi:hypothetical protein